MDAVNEYRERIQIGIDVGQRTDPAAIIVCEVQRRGHELHYSQRAKMPVPVGGEQHYVARFVERLPLGTPYPQLAERVANIIQALGPRRRAGKRRVLPLSVLVDATGVGQPVFDMIKAQVNAGTVTPVYLTGGDKVHKVSSELRLPKTIMVSRLQVLLQNRRIHLPDSSPHAQALIRELLDFELRITNNANLQSGAFRTGAHDDLAIALGLACWTDSRQAVQFGTVTRARPGT